MGTTRESDYRFNGSFIIKGQTYHPTYICTDRKKAKIMVILGLCTEKANYYSYTCTVMYMLHICYGYGHMHALRGANDHVYIRSTS